MEKRGSPFSLAKHSIFKVAWEGRAALIGSKHPYYHLWWSLDRFGKMTLGGVHRGTND